MNFVNHASSRLNQELREEVSTWLQKGKLIGVLGGDHSSPFGAIAAHLEHYPHMGILHIDAHHDLRQAYEGFTYSHASIMYNVITQLPFNGSLVSVGIRDFSQEEHAFAKAHPQIHTFYDSDLAHANFDGTTWSRQVEDIIAPLPKQVYVSFDVDGLDPKLCPNTGTPVPGGIDFQQAVFLIKALHKSGRRLIGFDLCEVAPNSRHPEDEWDLNVGARLLHMLCTQLLASKHEKRD